MANLSFQDASKAFIDSLPDRDKPFFSTIRQPKDILDELGNLKAPGFTKDRSRRALTRISTFIERATPYFKLVDTAIQSDPTIAALVWSSIRFVVQLSLNFSSYIDKLTQMIQRIGLILPMYEQYVDIFRHKLPIPLEQSLRRVYNDLLLFFHECIRLFSKDRSRIPKTPRLIANLLWVPFDARFGELLDRIQEHHDVVKEEAQIASMGLEEDERQAQERERQRQERSRGKLERILKLSESEKADRIRKSKEKVVRRCLKWIAAGNFTASFERAQSTREAGTAEWIFDTPEYLQWEQDSSASVTGPKGINQNILWIHGAPGRGKTILAGSIAERLQNSLDGNNSTFYGSSSGYFFFEQNGSSQTQRESEKAYRALISQILKNHSQNEDVIDKVSFIMDDKQTGQLTASRKQLLELLDILTVALGATAFVLDGIDECQDRKALVSDLFRLTDVSPNVKLIFLSRTNVTELYKKSKHILTFVLEPQGVRSDIETYLRNNLTEMYDDDTLPAYLDTQTALARLLDGANGMFLWARLMINLLSTGVLTPWKRYEIIMSVNLPEGLEQMYDRILQFLGTKNSIEQKIAKRIVSWALRSEISMTTVEMRIALRMAMQGARGLEDDISEDEIIICCAGLIEKVVLTDNVSVFRPIHLSLEEYFSTKKHPAEDRPYLWTDTDVDEELAIVCLSYLSYAVPAGPLSGDISLHSNSAIILPSFPFIRYAAMQWVPHLNQLVEKFIPTGNDAADMTLLGQSMDRISQAISNFLAHKPIVMAWIEAYYLYIGGEAYRGSLGSFEDLGLIGGILRGLTAESPKNSIGRLGNELERFSADLVELDKKWRQALVENPSMIWLDVTAFSKSEFWLESAATTVAVLDGGEEGSGQELLLEGDTDDTSVNGNDQLSLTPFAAADCVREDGAAVGILTIYCSSAMNELLKRPAASITFEALYQCSSGWKAKYEIWELSRPPRVIQRIWIELDQEEVWIQLCQTLRQDEASEWRAQFPMSIREDLQLLAILRTIHRFEDANKQPLDPNEHLDHPSFTVATIKLTVENLPQARQNWHTYDSLNGIESYAINAAEHFFEYNITFGHGGGDSLIVYTHHERANKKRTIAVFKPLWSGTNSRDNMVRSKTFVGGPSSEEVAAAVSNYGYIWVKPMGPLVPDFRNCSNFMVKNAPPEGRTLVAVNPQRQLVAYTTFFGISVWDYTSDVYENIHTHTAEHKSTSLRFSDCGRDLMRTDHDESENRFNPISEISIANRKVFLDSAFHIAESPNPSTTVTTTRKRKLEETGFLSDNQRVSIRNFSSGDSCSQWVSHDHKKSTIEVRRLYQDECTTQSLCSLPYDKRYRNRSAVVSQSTREGCGHVNIVLRKLPKHWHAIGSGEEDKSGEESPIIIQRAQGTFQAPRKTCLLLKESEDPGRQWVGQNYNFSVDGPSEAETKLLEGKRLRVPVIMVLEPGVGLGRGTYLDDPKRKMYNFAYQDFTKSAEGGFMPASVDEW